MVSALEGIILCELLKDFIVKQKEEELSLHQQQTAETAHLNTVSFSLNRIKYKIGEIRNKSLSQISLSLQLSKTICNICSSDPTTTCGTCHTVTTTNTKKQIRIIPAASHIYRSTSSLGWHVKASHCDTHSHTHPRLNRQQR